MSKKKRDAKEGSFSESKLKSGRIFRRERGKGDVG